MELEIFYNTYKYFNIIEFKLFYNLTANMKIIDILTYYQLNNIKDNLLGSIKDFYMKYPDFDLLFYKKFYNNLNFKKNYEYLLHYHTIGIKEDYISCNKQFNEKFSYFNTKIYKLFNNIDIKDDVKCKSYWYYNHLHLNIVYSIESFLKINSNFIKSLYCELYNIDNFDENALIYWYENKNNLIYSYETFINNIDDFDFNKFEKSSKDEIIYHYIHRVKNNINSFTLSSVNNISEVLIDLEKLHNTKLEKGISLIIRAKNEELNIKYCIESVIDLVDEIIFVDNNSTDKTYEFVEKYRKKYDKIKLYKYNINVTKAGNDHSNAIKDLNKNTLGTFYNWCLSKATKYVVFKWDADFICIRNNFIQLVDIYHLREREDTFAIWFTGKTLFENKNIYYINDNSYYDEYRIFSYKNKFKWYDGDVCEFTNPYLESCPNKFKYIYPLFYEIKRTSIDEFNERSSLLDRRDINDNNIIHSLKNNTENDLIHIHTKMLYNNKKIVLYTPSLSFGGGNQFIINLYNVLKCFGYNIKIIPINDENIGQQKFTNIMKEDIILSDSICFIRNFKPDFIFLNSVFPLNNINNNDYFTKIIFVTHSDVAYSNYFIEHYYKFFYRIITVNNYTIEKLSKLLNIDKNIFYKLTNYINISENNSYHIIKNKKFGIISRFSEDKNIPMFIMSLVDIFNKYPDYKCYFVGTHSNDYDNYLKYLCQYFNIIKNVIFTGYKDNVFEYYKLFDFIILPSVSEGCSYNIIESMAFGIPVITSNVGGNSELIKNYVNGILYDYNGIKEYEEKTVYINNYNKQLSIIGYFINNNKLNDLYINNSHYKNTEVVIPLFINCKKCTIYNYKCSICIYKENKMNIFNENIKNINDSIIEMIKMDIKKIEQIQKNNIDFFKKYFNKNKYINEILQIVN